MSRKFIATILAGALAVTGFTAAPARADADDLAKALAGIAAVAIIAKALDNNDKKKPRGHVQQHINPRVIDPPHRSRVTTRDRYDHGHLAPRPLPRRVERKLLPAQCMVRVNTRHGTERAFGRHCLTRNYRYTERLPQNCVMRTRGGGRTFYEASCLRSYGYSLARR